MGITPLAVQSTDAVKGMALDRRRCIFKDEDMKTLPIFFRPKAFKHYSIGSCNLECEANAIFKECNCLPYFYPNFGGVWGKSTSCDMEGLKCLAANYGT